MTGDASRGLQVEPNRDRIRRKGRDGVGTRLGGFARGQGHVGRGNICDCENRLCSAVSGSIRQADGAAWPDSEALYNADRERCRSQNTCMVSILGQ